MAQSHYLIVGSSHAALEAVAAIRMADTERAISVVTRDTHLPYSPTILPYIVSSRLTPDQATLRDHAYFDRQSVAYMPERAVARIDAARGAATLSCGAEIAYEKLLLATGASPVVPPIPGLDRVPFHVLRTLDDALRLRTAIRGARRAVVLGGGLVGMHAAENLVEAGAEVTIVEAQPRVLGAYLDTTAAALVERAFAQEGARIVAGRRAVGIAAAADGAAIELVDGQMVAADLLLIATGVKPDVSYLAGSGVDHDDGIAVDAHMRTNVKNIWAAGDCAKSGDFFGPRTTLNPILPDATEQGRIAGMAMADDPGIGAYPGGVPLNTYRFFGRHAIAVGTTRPGAEERVRHDEKRGAYLRVAVEDGRLIGIFSVGEFFDAGVMRQLILRRVDISGALDRLLADPRAVGREFMSRLWR